MSAALLLPPFQMRICWSASWYAHAMPRVVWETQAYAEQLMVSPARREVLDSVRSPWPAFMLDLPRDLLFSDNPRTKERCELQHVLVESYTKRDGETVWNWMAQGPGGIELWRHGLSTEYLIDPSAKFFSELYEGSIADEDELTLQYIGNLIVGACLTMSDPSKIRESKNTKAKRKGISEKREKRTAAPVTRNYVVGTPVKVRIRDAIKESYEAVRTRKGKRGSVKALKLATFVMGYWRNQPYGPNNSLRRPQHIEGYWRNLDKDNPIVVRPHAVTTKEETCLNSKKSSDS